MQYMLLIYNDESSWSTMSEEESQAVMGEYFAYTEWLQKSGLMQAGAALQPTPTARTVRVRDGERMVSDGPFAETREQLGGYYLIDAESEEQALEAAAKIPDVRRGSIEVRPVMQIPATA